MTPPVHVNQSYRDGDWSGRYLASDFRANTAPLGPWGINRVHRAV